MSTFSCAILTVSDTCFAKQKEDASGPALAENLQKTFPQFAISYSEMVPDDERQISSKLSEWVAKKVALVLTTGGTGLSSRDVTPEATKAVIEKEVPGIVHAMMAKSLDVTPMAMLSRAVCGIKDKTLIINFPGSKKGALECFSFIKTSIPHALSLICDNKREIESLHKKIQQELSPSKVDTRNVADRPRESLFALFEVEEAVNLILREGALEEGTETVKIEHALRRVLAEDVSSNEDIPAFDASIKDGYAVIAQDGAGIRRIKTYVAAGDNPKVGVLQRGEAVRIGTGAPIPPGADCVVQVEDTTLLTKQNGEEITIDICKAPSKGQDIRRAGTDILKNTKVLFKNCRLSSAHIGVLASLGQSHVKVYKQVPVGVLTTGNELKEHYEEVKPGQIRDSNRLTLINLLKEFNYTSEDYGIIRDETNSIKAAIARALQKSTILITTGGVSMGEFDFVKRVLIEDFNSQIHFGRVNMKPGKPTTFATFFYKNEKKIVFGLPGNPVSASVTCLLFVIPLLRHLERDRLWQFPIIPYIVSLDKPTSDPRPEYVRVIVKLVNGKLEAIANGGQISSRLNSLVGANGLLLRPGNMAENVKYNSKIILIGDLLTE